MSGSANERAASGPLTGLRILDLSRVLAGPFATMTFGDLGAEVVKVEHPDGGDDTRAWGPPFVEGTDGPVSTYYLSINRNKRSVRVDLKDPAERPFVEALVRWADVLVENFRPGVMDRLGLSDATLEEMNPRLVRFSLTGFGEEGPDATRVGYDHVIQAEAGLMSLTGPRGGPATKMGVPIADITAGLYAVIGILAALYERERSGEGQRVSTSLLAGQVAIHTFQGARYLVAGEVPEPLGNDHPSLAPYGAFRARDAEMVIAVGNDAMWRRFAVLVGLDPDDPDYATNAHRVANFATLSARIDEALGARDVGEWLVELERAAVPAGAVKRLDAVYADAQVRHEGLAWSVDHPSLGPIELPGSPLRFSNSTLGTRYAPPGLGAHDDEVRREIMGGGA